MKRYIVKGIFIPLFAMLTIFPMACHDTLEEVPYSQFSPNNFLTTENGLNTLLFSAYGNALYRRFPIAQLVYLEEATTDIFLQSGGGQAKWAKQLIDFTFDPEHNWIRQQFQGPWDPIRDVNMFLENVENVEFKDSDKNARIGEAKFIRAFLYFWMTGYFGEIPLITSTEDDLYPTKASIADIRNFIETELTEAVSLLPVKSSEYGRASKGAALGILMSHYLNTRQWQNAADAANQIIELQEYALYPDYVSLFGPDNDLNSEYIFVSPQTRDVGYGNTWMALSMPPKYPILPNQKNFAAHFKYYDSFVNSFDLNDDRRKVFLTEYTDATGKLKQLLGNNDSRSFKFYDNESNSQDQENDVPIIRYAEVLLARAEALNELSGPTQEAIDLINVVRERAKVDLLNVGDFSKESLRDHILQERAWEFFSEGKRRTDLLRHGKFIQQALDRGKAASDHHRYYPIPQVELNANPALTQNDGY